MLYRDLSLKEPYCVSACTCFGSVVEEREGEFCWVKLISLIGKKFMSSQHVTERNLALLLLHMRCALRHLSSCKRGGYFAICLVFALTLTSVLQRGRGSQVTHIVTSLCSWDFHLINSLTVWRGLDRLKDFIRPLISLIVCSFIPSSPTAQITHWANNFSHYKYHLVSHNCLIQPISVN